MSKYNITIIGSGPGGYVAAIRCAQLGLKTALVEKYPSLGGTCLNVGCIPSKALLDSSEHYHNAVHRFKEHGIKLSNLGVNLKQMIKRKDDVVSQTVEGVKYLMKKNKIDVHTGHGSFKDTQTIVVKDSKGKKSEIKSDNFIIATGSKPAPLKGVTIDKKRVLTSTEILNLETLPKHLLVIGGGVIGLELGSVFARMGTKVSVVEYMDSIVSTMDKTMGKELEKVLKKLGFTFYCGHAVTGVNVKGTKVTVSAKDKARKAQKFEGDYCLLSVGRKPYTENLGLENVGVRTDSKGRVEVNEKLQTNVANIYAIGDVVRGAMLAHKAEEEGIFVAEILAGQKPHINYLAIPNVVYTWPEVAGVGYTEQELKEKAIQYKTGSFPFKASGRARASMDTDGVVRVYADKQSDEILGMHIIGPRAADMIAEGVVALEYKASAEDISRMSHAHPTYTEAIKEACLAATENRALHI